MTTTRTTFRAHNDAEIITAQAELLDHTGHVRAHLTAKERARLVQRINAARHDNGWSPLNLNDR